MSVHILKGTKLSKIKIDDWIMLSANYCKVWKQCFTFESICWINNKLWLYQTSLVAQTVKCLPAVQETRVWSLGREDPRRKNPLQYSCLENPMDGGAWWATVCGVAKSWTGLSDFTFFHFHFWLNHIQGFQENVLKIRNAHNKPSQPFILSRTQEIPF